MSPLDLKIRRKKISMQALNETLTALGMNRKSWYRWLMAAVIVILAHLLLFGLFKEKPLLSLQPPGEFKKVIFLPLNEKLPVSASKLKLAILYGNPEAISKPSLFWGFSSAIAMRGFRKQIPDIQIEKEILPDIKYTAAPFEKLETITENSEDKISRLWKYSLKTLPISKTVHGKPVSLAYPLWKTPDGDVLPQLFTNLESVRKDVKKFKPLKPTILKITDHGMGIFPRVEVESSCDIPELDREAAGAFISKYETIFPDGWKNEGSENLEILWGKEGAPK